MTRRVNEERLDCTQSAQTSAPPMQNKSKVTGRRNLLLAINPLYGVVAWWVYEENTDAALFAFFVTDILIPAINNHTLMTVLWDR